MTTSSQPKLQELFDAKENGESLLPIFQRVFSDFHESELDIIDEMNLGIAWIRQGSALAKYVSFKKIGGLDEEKMGEIVDSLKSTLDSLGDSWNPSLLVVIPNKNPARSLDAKGPVSYDWDKAEKLENFKAWSLANDVKEGKESSLVFQKSPPFSPSIIENAPRGFVVQITPAVTNPEDGEVWSYGEDVTKDIMKDIESGLSWEQCLNKYRDKWEEEAEISSLFPALRPNIELTWRVHSPDHKTIKTLPPEYKNMHHISKSIDSDWSQSFRAREWMDGVHDKIATAMSAFSYSYVLSEKQNISNYKLSNKDLKQFNLNIESAKEILGVADGEEFSSYFKRLENDYPDISKSLMGVFSNASLYSSLLTSSYNNRFVSKILRKMNNLNVDFGSSHKDGDNLFKNISLTRKWLSSLDWVNDDGLQKYIDTEKSFVAHAVDVVKENGYRMLASSEVDDFKQVAVWNGFADDFISGKIKIRNPSSNNHEDLIDDNDAVTPSIKTKQWQPLINAFNIEYEPDDSLSHPFMNWIKRLQLPTQIEKSTTNWFIQSNQFNEINRVLLRKKDSDESHLHEELAQKLKNVLEVTNTIMEENKKSGGWWGRVRKGFSSSDPEKWADTFLDFQSHIHKMFVSIDEQIEKDEIWLENANELVEKSSSVDEKWSGWLQQEAKTISQSHGGDASTEKRMSWDKRVELLTSSRNAHQNIINSIISTKVWLDKVNQSVQTKRQLKERAEMFYWSSLSMFSSLQSIQRNTNTIMEQADLVKTMSKSAEGASLRALYEEEGQREKIREAFVKMSQSESAVKEFHEKMSSFQAETSVIMQKSLKNRQEISVEDEITWNTNTITSDGIKQKQKQKEMAIDISNEKQQDSISINQKSKIGNSR